MNAHRTPAYTPDKIIAFTALMGLLFLTWLAGNWGMADIYARPAMTRISSANGGGLELGSDVWIDLQSSLRKAIELNQGNPEYLQAYALAMSAPYKAAPRDDTMAISVRQQSLQYLRQVIQMRPTWPFIYNELVWMKYRLGQIDDEFFDALRSALKYGPSEPGIMRTTIGMSILYWNQLTSQEQQQRLDLMRRIFQHTSTARVRQIEVLIIKGGFTSRVCAVDKQGPALARFCDKHSYKTN